MPDEAKQAILVTDVTQGIEALKRMVSESEEDSGEVWIATTKKAAMNLNLSSPPNLCFCSMTIPSIP